jgi:CxxC motif-containing protein
MNTDVKTEEEIRKQKKLELMSLVTELSREITRLDDILDRVKTIVYNL